MHTTKVTHEHHLHIHIPPELAALIPLLALPATLTKMETRIMTKLDDVLAAQAATNAKLDELATSEAAQSADLIEIGADMTKALEMLAAADPDSPQTQQALDNANALLARLTEAATASQAQSDALRAVAGQFPPAA